MPASASPGYKGSPPCPHPPLQKPPPSHRCMHTYSYLFHPTRPPDMFAVYHPTRPPDPSSTRGQGTSLHGHHPPGLRFSCAVHMLPQPVKFDFADALLDDTPWRASLHYPALIRTTTSVVASARHPGAHSKNTRPDRVLQSRRRPGTIQCRPALCPRAYASPLSNTRALLFISFRCPTRLFSSPWTLRNLLHARDLLRLRLLHGHAHLPLNSTPPPRSPQKCEDATLGELDVTSISQHLLNANVRPQTPVARLSNRARCSSRLLTCAT
ncbi:hypothetical protein L227DRAFT_159190 [Lentinus tigrinus ALCF2SS1-6]|uniref:Uncharacterized protein n=1 Tax=Lentinus tigrinus ALCF2SS1-6 TaxID=1328759 RepID=A0A5C2S6J6_9APHY|nr:hypothetical protein L227DRAFT_159190 [Lentinus tigrinus ALCF2SS1-6]